MSSTQQDQHGLRNQRCQEADKPHRRRGEEKYTCDQCGKTFTQAKSLKTHQLIHSGKYSCDQCGRAFTSNKDLKRHQVTHSGIKAYGCDFCGKTFSQLGNRNVHLRTHTGHVYCCGQCGKKFTTNTQLQQHMFTHAEERPYQCDLCDKTFKAPRYLKAHQQIHSRKRLYKCSYCEVNERSGGFEPSRCPSVLPPRSCPQTQTTAPPSDNMQIIPVMDCFACRLLLRTRQTTNETSSISRIAGTTE